MTARYVYFQLAAKKVFPKRFSLQTKEKHQYLVDLGFIKIQLYDDIVPKTCRNFAEIARHTPGFGYTGSVFSHIVKGFGMYGGDVVSRCRFKQPYDRDDIDLDWRGAGEIEPFAVPTEVYPDKLALGLAGRSIYGPKMYDNVYEDETFYEDENFQIKHDKPGIVTMANTGPNTNTSRFVVLSSPASYLDGKNVAFGEVTDGIDTIQDITNTLGTLCGHPTLWVEIVQSGVLDQEHDKLPEPISLQKLNTPEKSDPFAYRNEIIRIN